MLQSKDLTLITSLLRRAGVALRQDEFIVNNRGRISTGGVLDEYLFGAALAKVLSEHRSPFVLQVGANTGDTVHDMREQLMRSGARALLVEPQPDAFRLLMENYAALPAVSVANVALSTCAGTRDLYKISSSVNRFHARGGIFGNSIASFDPKHPWEYFLRNANADGRRLGREEVIESVSVRCVPIELLVEQFGIDRVDVLAVDTEGFDFEVLKMVVSAGFSPTLIKYEHKHLPGGRATVYESWQFLIDCGYRLVAVRATGDTVAVKVF